MRDRNHRKVFLVVNGPGPWPCYYGPCEEFVQPDELLVHHLDEDPMNNDPANLTAMHDPCHVRLHRTGQKLSAEARTKIGEANSRRVVTAETRAKIRDANLGKIVSAETRRRSSEAKRGIPKTVEHKQKIREALLGRPTTERQWQCGECPMVTRGSNLARHQRASGHVGRVRS